LIQNYVVGRVINRRTITVNIAYISQDRFSLEGDGEMKDFHVWKTDIFYFQWLPRKVVIPPSTPFWIWLWFGFRIGKFNSQNMKWEK